MQRHNTFGERITCGIKNLDEDYVMRGEVASFANIDEMTGLET